MVVNFSIFAIEPDLQLITIVTQVKQFTTKWINFMILQYLILFFFKPYNFIFHFVFFFLFMLSLSLVDDIPAL